LAHIGGLMHGLHMPFETGARAVLDDRWEPSRAADRVAAAGVTFLGGAPVFPQGLVDAFADHRGSPLRVVCTGGASIPDRLGDDVRTVLGARLARSYGSTECPFASGSLPDDTAEQCDADDGALMPSVEARVAGSDDLEAEGELLLRAACQFQGYIDEAQNRDVIRDGWFATGDLVVRRGQRIKVSGRLKAIAIRNGENISLDEVERAFDDWADATEVAAFAVPDDRTGERVVLAVVLRDAGAPSYEAMIAHLADRTMARQKYPEQVVAWPSLPRTASGKVDRPALVAGVASRPSAFAPRLQASSQ
jgi:cyclohexanecarboxylate-CoA ligase